MKIAVYGGSFNPIHKGHEEIVKYVLKNLPLDKFILMPVGVPPHKENLLASAALRYKMCQEAMRKIPEVEVSDIELKINGPAYTIETLKKLEKIYDDAEFYLIIGEDSAQNFHTWKDYEEILEKYHVVILKRKGYENPLENEKCIILNMPYFDISATEIRQGIEEGKDMSSVLSKDVLKIIEKEKLYKKTASS